MASYTPSVVSLVSGGVFGVGRDTEEETSMVHLILVGIDDEHRMYAMNDKSEGKLEIWKIGKLTLRYFGTTAIDLPLGYVGDLKFAAGVAEKFPLMQVATSPGAPVQTSVPAVSMTPTISGESGK